MLKLWHGKILNGKNLSLASHRTARRLVRLPSVTPFLCTATEAGRDECCQSSPWPEDPLSTTLTVTDLGPYAPQGSTPLLPKLSVISKVSAPTSHAWVGSRVHFRSSEDVTLLEFTSPIDREKRTSDVRINVGSTDFEHQLHFGSFRLPCGAYGPCCRTQKVLTWGLLFFGWLTSQQHASVSQGLICSDDFTCCHTEV